MSYPSAGSIRKFTDQWIAIGAPRTVVSWVSEGVPLPFSSIPTPFLFCNRAFSPPEILFIDREVRRLLECGAIERCPDVPGFISPLHCVPKKGSDFRLILNLSHLNNFVNAPRFRNDDIRVVADYIQNDDLLVSVDIKNGFYHVPVRECDRKYLSFMWNDAFYRFTVTPFGLCISPYYFCKIVRPVIYLRELGVRLSVYVDDFCLSAPPAQIADHTDLLLNSLEDLGFHVNFEKSQLRPDKVLDYIGYTIRVGNPDGNPFICAQRRRVANLRKDISRALKQTSISARTLARIAGQCVSVAWCVEPAKLLLRGVYRVLSTRQSWSSQLILTPHCREDLAWWVEAVNCWNGKSICHRPIEAQVITDASHLAWGAVLGNKRAGGDWDIATSRRSSNYRELLAILLALLSFQSDIRGKSIQILSDNVTALAYIQHKGGPNAPLTEIARAIWSLAVRIGLSIVCKHIAGKDNILADTISRRPDKHDWQLHPQLFAYLDRLWGPHTIDRFASYRNSQLPTYNSRYLDPHTSGVDAFAQGDWHSHNNFVNAPFCLLTRVLDTICHHQATATIIAPYWKAQPFLARLKRLSIRPPLLLPSSARLFRRRGVLPEPLRNPHWRVLAWRVCGRLD